MATRGFVLGLAWWMACTGPPPRHLDGPTYLSDVFPTPRAMGLTHQAFRQVVLTAELRDQARGELRFLVGTPSFDALGQPSSFDGSPLTTLAVRVARDETASSESRDVYTLQTEPSDWQGRLTLVVDRERHRRDLLIDMSPRPSSSGMDAQVITLHSDNPPDASRPMALERYGSRDTPSWVGRDRTWSRDTTPWSPVRVGDDARTDAPEPIPMVHLDDDGRGWVMFNHNHQLFDAAGRLSRETLVGPARHAGRFEEDDSVTGGASGERLLRFVPDEAGAIAEDTTVALVTHTDGPRRMLVWTSGELNEVWPLARAPSLQRRQRARIQLETPQITGSRSVDAFGRIVAKQRAHLRYCYERELKEHPGLQGTLEVSFTLSRAGTPSDIEVDATGLDHVSLRDCVVSRFEKMRFAASDDDTPSRASVRILLSYEDT